MTDWHDVVIYKTDGAAAQLKVAVLFNIFNRPLPTQQVFDVIRQVRPQKLFVHADGARADKVGEQEKTEACRKILTDQVDWQCELHLLFRKENLGCGKGPASAITWFFENVEEGIILEDDCLPIPDFFRFAELMLSKYRDDKRVTSVAGSNFQDGKTRGSASYYFSHHNRIWGWATWRRTWQHYDYYLDRYSDETIDETIEKTFTYQPEIDYWKRVMHTVKRNRLDDSCWDYQFMFMQWYLGGLTTTANRNLISNIGDGTDATHTNWQNNPNLNRPTEPLGEISYTDLVVPNPQADRYYMRKYILPNKNIFLRAARKLLKYLR